MNPRRELLAMLYAEVLSRGNYANNSNRMADAPNPVARPEAGPGAIPPGVASRAPGPANSSIEHNDKQGPAQLDTARRRTLLSCFTVAEGRRAVKITNGRK